VALRRFLESKGYHTEDHESGWETVEWISTAEAKNLMAEFGRGPDIPGETQ
jgi:hypothetical protein